jgi:hypothetical protein
LSTLATIRTAILANLDRSGVGATEKTTVDSWINQVIREDLCSDHDWSFLEKTEDVTTVDGTDVYEFLPPANSEEFKDCRFLRIRRDATSDFVRLTELGELALFENYTEQTKGYPLAWARTYSTDATPADAFRLRLVPDAAYLIRVHYWAYPAVLTADGDTNPLLTRQRKLLELGVTARALLHYGEDAKAQLWIQLWDREYAKAINNDRRRMAVSNGTFRISTVAGRPAAGRRGTLNPFRQTPYGWM